MSDRAPVRVTIGCAAAKALSETPVPHVTRWRKTQGDARVEFATLEDATNAARLLMAKGMAAASGAIRHAARSAAV